jgi:hypothetical protein
MTTPVEAHFGWKWLLSAKNALTRVFAYGKQIAMLEARVAAPLRRRSQNSPRMPVLVAENAP